jgi:hypothetical protein
MPKRARWIHAGAAFALLAAVAIGLLSRGSGTPTAEPDAETPPLLPSAEVRTWKAAALKVEERRGEPVGMAASVRVPAELKHYAERRRFLAIQVAKAEEHDITLPHDEAALVEMVRAGELVRMPVLGDDYILYGVGGSATGEPFAHWDERTGARIPLYDGWAEYKDEDEVLASKSAASQAEAAGFRAQLKRTRAIARNRTRRRQLLAKARAAESARASVEAQRKRLAAWYENEDRRRLLVGELRLLQEFARDFDGRTWDMAKQADRRLLRTKLLQYVRPEARDYILELARQYHAQFGRPLPVTSLVRSEAYQLQLGGRNPNATTIESPPHATGYAFDAFYGRMAAAEQEQLMDLLARDEDAGRVEALRETRNHFHVFVFPDGRPPSEKLIADALDDVRPVRANLRTSGGARAQSTASRMRRAASVKRAPTRRTAARKAPARPATRRTKRPPTRH